MTIQRWIRTAPAALLTSLFLLAGLAQDVGAQEGTGTVRLRVESHGTPLPGAEVRAGRMGSLTDAQGLATLWLPAGSHTISAYLIGYARGSTRIDVRAGMDTTLVIALEEDAIETEGVVVLSTRTGRRIEDEPIRVEVVEREEIEEKLLMTPGDIAMLLNETSGLRVQTTSPSLAGANVRVQGLRGRYTQILSDGLPLYGGQSGSLGLLQIPPMDLGQVEVIKGVASALYGSSALGGVVNLISRRPSEDERELLLNATALGGADVVSWTADQLSDQWAYTFLGSGHRQARADIDDDGWADVPGYTRGVLRPRFFWADGTGRSLFITLGATAENRRGGTIGAATVPSGTSFPEELETRRLDAGVVGQMLVAGDRLLSLRASAMGQDHEHRFGAVQEQDSHGTTFGELSLSGADGAHTWAAGAALQHEFADTHDVPALAYAYTVASAFAQDEVSIAEWLTLAASGRADVHSEFGALFNPRLSALVRPGDGWTARLSAGTGYFAPTPFTEETEAVGLTRLLPLDDLQPEQARSASLDVGRAFGPVELNATLFGSVVDDALRLRQARGVPGSLELVNVAGPTHTYGTELLARWVREPLHLTATHTFVRSTEPADGAAGRREVPLTPRHTAGIVGMWENEGRTRLGIELYYTGRQMLDENPYREASEPYTVLGMLVEQRVGRVRFFLNAENLTGVRQTRYDSLLLPVRSAEGRWTTDAWAPLEGRVFNGGVRVEF